MDLAGGTADLWPLYLYLGGLELVNMAIDVKAKVDIEWTPLKQPAHSFELSSKDFNRSIKYKDLAELEKSLSLDTTQNPLRWVARLTHHYLKDKASFGHWKVSTQSDAPPGSGLGGSSVLGVALSRALAKALKQDMWRDEWDLQSTTRDLESIEIQYPAGDQDYVPAIFGGLLIFKMGPNKKSVEKLPTTLADKISNRTALLYTGKPHHSGLNNWQVFTEIHKPKSKVKKHLQEIVQISHALAQDLRKNELGNLSDLINQEWECRKKLSPAINASVLDKAWRFGKTRGATARKACGAGGGGCLLLVFDSAEDKFSALKSKLPDSSWKWLSTIPA